MWPFTSSGVKFTEKDIPSLDGKVIFITGANSGLGLQSASDLARHNPSEIWVTARTVEKANDAIAKIKKTVPNNATTILKPLALDLSSFASIKAAARTFTQASQRLDILLCNAGIMAAPEGLTTEGYEQQFGTNHMGHALLTKLLTPLLDKTAATPNADVRVVYLSSAAVAMYPTGGIAFDTLKTTQGDLPTFTRYGQSKLANALYARAQAGHKPKWTVVAVHPGVVQTNLMHNIYERFGKILAAPAGLVAGLVLTTVATGAQNQLWACTAPGGVVKSGELYYPVGDPIGGRRGEYWRDEALAKRLYEWTEEELKGHDI